MKIAIVIGHNARSKGAYSTKLKDTEYGYCKKVCEYIKELDDSVDIFERIADKNYIREMSVVINKINKEKYDCIVELHFNASTNEEAKGCECLVYKHSSKGKNIADYILKELNKEYGTKIRNGGLIEVEDSKQRGAFGICKTKDPYILLEPFFGTNSEEAKKFINFKKFAKFLLKTIRR